MTADPVSRRVRAQSNVVGVALLVGLTMLSLGALTATVGTVLESNAAAADTDRVAADLDDAVQPVEVTGHHDAQVTFTDGTLRTIDRTVRVHRDGDLVVEREAGGIAYETGDYAVRSVAGAVVRDYDGSATVTTDPPAAVDEGVALFGVAVVDPDATFAVEGSEPTTVTLATTVSHDRVVEGVDGEYAFSVETASPEAWERHFEERGATVKRETYPGDDHPSVVATFDGDRTGYVVVHRVELEVRDG